jgi:hypothetical protein
MDALDPNETLIRFACWSNEYSKANLMLKPKAFEVPSNRVLSTFRRQGRDDAGVWQIAGDHVDRSGRVVKAAGMLSVADFTMQRLRAIPDVMPPGHVGISDWPTAPGEEMSIAQLLSRRSAGTLIIRSAAASALEQAQGQG